MKFLLDSDILLPETGHNIVVIGNFDGVHLGHQALIEYARALCDKGQKLVVLSFDPHPRRIFKPDEANFQITGLQSKTDRLQKIGVDIFAVLKFDTELASMRAIDFIQDILLKRLKAEKIVVGTDFCFGQGREGSVAFLENHAERLGYEVHPFKQKTIENGEIISSSLIRNYIRAGDIEQANRILGWDWYVQAPVIRGDQRGRELGYPTANQMIDPYIYPRFGVYAVRVQLPHSLGLLPAVANFGIRPMFKSKVPLMETHIFNFNQEIYGQDIKIYPVSYIRPEARFESLDALIKQIDADSAKAKKILEVE